MHKTLTIQTDTINNQYRSQLNKLQARSPRVIRDRVVVLQGTQNFVSKTGTRLDSPSISNFPVVSTLSPKIQMPSTVKIASSHQEAFANWLAESRPFHYVARKPKKTMAFPEELFNVHRKLEAEARGYNLNTLELSAIGKTDETLDLKEKQNPLNLHKRNMTTKLGSQTERAEVSYKNGRSHSRPVVGVAKSMLPKSIVTLKPFSPNANSFSIVKQQAELPEFSLLGLGTNRNYIIKKEQKFFDVDAFSKKFKEIKDVEEKRGSLSPKGKKCVLHEIEPKVLQLSTMRRSNDRETPKNKDVSINLQTFSRKDSAVLSNKAMTDRLHISIKEDNLASTVDFPGSLNTPFVLPFSQIQNQRYISNYEIKRKQRRLEKEARKHR